MSDPSNLECMRQIVLEEVDRGNLRLTTKRSRSTNHARPAVALSDGTVIPIVRLRYNPDLGFFDRKTNTTAICEIHGDK